MSTIERVAWRVKKLRHEHPIGIDLGERVAKAMFAHAYPKGFGKHALTWTQLHGIALGEVTIAPHVSRNEAMRIRRYWRTLAGIALREGATG